MKKRILALVLAIVLTASLLPVTAAAAAPTPDTSWYGDGSATTFTLTDAADLLGLATLVNNGTSNFAGKTVKLGANIDLGGIDWTPIGSISDSTKRFLGEFDGKGKIISNLTMNYGDCDSSAVRAGLFTAVAGKLSNLSIKNTSITASGSNIRAGALCGSVFGGAEISNVVVDGFTYSGSGWVRVGGLTGYCYESGGKGANGIYVLNGVTVKNVNITITSGYAEAGGVAGYNNGYFSVNNVTADTIAINASITANNGSTTDVEYSGIGGFFGGDHGNGAYNFRDCTVKNLAIALSGTEKAHVGGFGGNARGGICTGTGWDEGINYCSAQGTITNNNTNTNSDLGGFYGLSTGGGRKYLNAVANVSIVSTVGTVGGFVGTGSYWVDNIYTDCEAIGDVTGASSTTGSFVGNVNESHSKFVNSSSVGKANGDANGSFFGASASITSKYYTVFFECNNGSTRRVVLKAPTEGTVTVSEPAEPTRVGYRFEGWFSDPACEQSYDFETPITENTTIYAKWDKIDGLAWLTPILGALNTASFDDVVIGDWFYDAVRYVNEYGLMTGTSANQFSPNAPVTRGMLMTILARREGIRTDRYSPWYAAGCEWAKANGISDGTNPEAAITREELATMLYRYASLKGYDLSGAALTSFSDANGVSSYAVPAMQWAVGAGLISGAAGVDAGKLLPQQAATRAQLAAILHRFFG